MSSQVVLGRGSAIVLAASVVIAGVAVAGGAFLGGYAVGESRASAPVIPAVQPERVYTEDELRSALDTCGRDDVEVVDGVAVVDPVDRQTLGTCVLMWLEAPGPVFTEYAYSGSGFGTTGSVGWANVALEWEHIEGGRQTTITVE